MVTPIHLLRHTLVHHAYLPVPSAPVLTGYHANHVSSREAQSGLCPDCTILIRLSSSLIL